MNTTLTLHQRALLAHLVPGVWYDTAPDANPPHIKLPFWAHHTINLPETIASLENQHLIVQRDFNGRNQIQKPSLATQPGRSNVAP